ncbi:DUF3570 domain-containing protein [Marinomonas transparens]|uniref:DUF3570 domain-containing protein n=1 Tax=Marinomonas transparens TaxID=2795388 RepID=A0A934JLP5_9GAMM|nr:DUF3570 domain-containing protein [Marinomonas transparens]MBJ7538111.1 DUF3570 domain-containing protein [Marinomonas transparens]
MAVTKTMKKNKDLARLLTAASCALVSGLSTTTHADDSWDVDSAFLLYSESDSRVSAVEPVVSATKNYDEETKLNFKIVADTLTGASPNGATPSDQVQTFTSPSGKSSYNATAGEQPLDDTFKDTRIALSSNWSAPINRDWAYGVGGYLSAEHDYRSLGVNGNLSRYLNQKNTTLTLGLNLSNDAVTPEGGVPTGLHQIPLDRSDSEFTQRSDSENKNLVDAVFGVTQVINSKTIMQFNYALSTSSGYLTDPYKMLSVIDDTAGSNFGGNFQSGGNNVYLYEKRPDSRLKQSIYWQTKHQFDNSDVLDVSYRFMFDDWGVNSHTIDAKYRFRFDNQYLEPQLRWYTQSKADFYNRYLTSSDYTNTSLASADYRLGDLDTYTIGLRYGYEFADNTEFYTRFSLYHQESSGEKGIGKLASQELYPGLDSMMLIMGYKF